MMKSNYAKYVLRDNSQSINSQTQALVNKYLNIIILDIQNIKDVKINNNQ